ncbi:hypothetical protein JTB14_005231 [Gonioctena quinquepunctata]|nr:hypothetical protein JTB14_005231 [Gonioctena quinquepunctata]
MATTDRPQILNELNKLKKKYLTNIITTGELSKSVDNQVVKRFFINSRLCISCSSNESSIVAETCADVLANDSNLSYEVIVLRTDYHGPNRLLHHFEKRGVNQVPFANTTQTPSSDILFNYSEALTTSDEGPISGTSNLEPVKLPYTNTSKEGSRTNKVTA